MNDLYSFIERLKGDSTKILQPYSKAVIAKVESYLKGELTMPPSYKSKSQIRVENDIAILEVNGAIDRRLGLPEEVLSFLGIVDLDILDGQLKEVAKNPAYKAAILNVTSPGGYDLGLRTTGLLVGQLASVKEAVVFSDLLNASAAYEISSQASSILATIDARIGSIGSYIVYYDTRKLYEANGVEVKVFKSGEYKGIGTDGTSLTKEEEAIIQERVDKGGDEFRAFINTKRNIAPEDMRGNWYKGQEALEKGFVDGVVSSIDDVIAALSSK